MRFPKENLKISQNNIATTKVKMLKSVNLYGMCSDLAKFII